MNLFDLSAEPTASAVISPCGLYRYSLTRHWGDPAGQVVNWIMLNPSTAGAESDDPTIRRCIGYAKGWGFAGLTVTNLFAYRSTDPEHLRWANDPIGPENDDFIELHAMAVELVIVAWGVRGSLGGRDCDVLAMLDRCGVDPRAIRASKDGHPWHPLYLPKDLRPFPFGSRKAVRP